MQNKIDITLKNIKKNNMQSFFAEKTEDIVPLLKTLIPKGATVGVGGSVTLQQSGVLDLLRSGDYVFYDRNKEGLTPEEVSEIMAKSLTADVFICSSNAITQNGQLYNVDGRANRIAAICYGPKSVIIVAGANKIVEDIYEAKQRVKTIAAPKNAKRLSCNTPCEKLGHCVSAFSDGAEICDGCQAEFRICSNYLISAKQMVKDRIKVVLCREELGY